jgi:hypothetical protein
MPIRLFFLIVHETVDQDIKRVLIDRDVATLKQAFCMVMCAEIRNSETRVFVPVRLFLRNLQGLTGLLESLSIH